MRDDEMGAAAAQPPGWQEGTGDPAALPLLSHVQPKLMVGQIHDHLEDEADRVADQVMGLPEPQTAAVSPRISRKCSSCEQEEEAQRLQAKRTAAGSADVEAPALVTALLRSPGRPLEAGARGFMEPRLGRDLSDVRIHTGPLASRSAEAVTARAYTVGRNIVFRSGEYAPDTTEGRRLLAHELAHVLQQRPAKPAPKTLRSSQVTAATSRVQRQDDAPPEQGSVTNLASTSPPLSSSMSATSEAPATSTASPPVALAPDMTSQMSIPAKLVEAIRRGMQSEQLGSAAAGQLKALLDPESVAIGILFWIASHYDGVGELLDAVGLIFEGLQFKSILEDLWNYGTTASAAQTDADLDKAGEYFANAVVAAGVVELMSVIEELGGERKGPGEEEKPLEDHEPSPEEEGENEESELPDTLAGCRVGSITCSIEQLSLEPRFQEHINEHASFEEYVGPFNADEDVVIGKSVREGVPGGDEAYARYLERVGEADWSEPFTEAMHRCQRPGAVEGVDYRKVGPRDLDRWPLDDVGSPWQVHHEPPLQFGGKDEPEYWKPMPYRDHLGATEWWRALEGLIREQLSPEQLRAILDEE